MPSDPRVTQALEALARPIGEFRAAVEGALAQADGHLAAHRATAGVRRERAGAELGAFGAGHIRAEAFAETFPPAGRGDPVSLDTLERVVAVLRDIAARGDELFVTEVTEGRKLGATVDEALAVAGRAFGAIVIAELVRAGRYEAEEHDRLLDAFEFRSWNRAERRFAPPLIIRLAGADLHAGALTDFADGHEKLLLVVDSPCAPAPLARCISPGTLVVQTIDGAGLELLAPFDGPAVAAIMPAGAATFVHDPRGGEEPWQRLALGALPQPPTRAIGGLSAWQMAEDLRLLTSLARTPFAVPTAGGPGTPALGTSQAVDQLAAWLLDQTDLDGATGGAG